MPKQNDLGLRPKGSLFGTDMIAIGRTPFDRAWSRVSKAGSVSKFNRALASSGVRNGHTELEKLALLNNWVNEEINYREDSALYAKDDYWASARETLARKAGDCEDFAIVKMGLLLAAGFKKDKIRLVIARDLVRNSDHALLVVTLSDDSFVLDNATNTLLDARLTNDYRPIMSFSGDRKWLHGYAVEKPAEAPDMQIAMLSVPSAPLTLP